MKGKEIIKFEITEQERKRILKEAKENGFSSVSDYIQHKFCLLDILIRLKEIEEKLSK